MTTQDGISNIIKTLRVTISNLRIYPAKSQIVTGSISTLCEYISSGIATEHGMTISRLADKLLINDTEAQAKDVLSGAAQIIKVLETCGIQSITFRAGLSTEELSDFIAAILRAKKKDLPEYPHIALDQTVYVATVKGEDMVVKISDTIRHSGGDIGGLITSIRESYDVIDTAPTPEIKEELNEHLAQELAQQDPSVLREIFDRELPLKLEQSGIKTRLLSALTKEKIQEIFGEISQWYNDIRTAEGSDFAAVEKLEKLKSFIQTVLNSFENYSKRSG